MTDYWYLATAYSKYPDGIDAAFLLAVWARGLLLRAGITSFSPIVHSHPVAVECGIDPFDHSIWLPSEEAFLERAFGLIVVMDDHGAWQTSHGVTHEIDEFIKSHRPIIYMRDGCIPEHFNETWNRRMVCG